MATPPSRRRPRRPWRRSGAESEPPGVSMSVDPLSVLRAELASLRRRVRVLAVLLGCALALAGVALWEALRAGPAAPPAPAEESRVLVGRSLYLREDPERPYVRLKYLHAGAGLILADAEGKGQAH